MTELLGTRLNKTYCMAILSSDLNFDWAVLWNYALKLLSLGAYGAAVLYRKKDDDSLVILKEISLHELTATERQMAMNEVTC